MQGVGLDPKSNRITTRRNVGRLISSKPASANTSLVPTWSSSRIAFVDAALHTRFEARPHTTRRAHHRGRRQGRWWHTTLGCRTRPAGAAGAPALRRGPRRRTPAAAACIAGIGTWPPGHACRIPTARVPMPPRWPARRRWRGLMQSPAQSRTRGHSSRSGRDLALQGSATRGQQ